jgi:hypothetical protein
MTAVGTGTKDDPWRLRTPPGTSEFQLHRDDDADPPELVCQVGSTKLRYLARCIEDVPAMLREHGGWMELGSADENKPAKEGTLEAWARAASNPVGGWYGLRKGYRGRLPCMWRPCSNTSDSSSWSTSQRTTACALAERVAIRVPASGQPHGRGVHVSCPRLRAGCRCGQRERPR